ncbi:unnamed protein product [Spirodela intermedia]|uniref:Uncharacterized protein n=1 Tax=Spirodela intermedia TaxID=51605 RepID=A0A7I8K6P3_SPIIN|nr:unnamed protein product [Spirodela intermedia]
MEVSLVPRSVPCRPSAAAILPASDRLNPGILRRGSWIRRGDTGRVSRSSHVIRAIEGPSDLPPVEISWQITVGALAGITPFVVAGIEFSKRIAAQRSCEVCGGSGLVEVEGLYGRCPGCGGFLPWQSWKRFFTG